MLQSRQAIRTALLQRAARRLRRRLAALRAKPSPRRVAEAGFSLVELAIVLIIIGLLVGGVLSGQTLIESARVNAVQIDLSDIRIANSTFMQKFQYLPGDIPASNERAIPGWTPATLTAAPGQSRGNGRIEGDRYSGDTGSKVTEATLFWQHLRAANLLNKVGTTQGQLNQEARRAASIGGFYTVGYTKLNSLNGHWLQLGDVESSSATNNTAPVLSPNQLRIIDEKYDDKRPNTGSIGGDNPTNSNACRITSGTTVDYAVEDADAVACYAYFKLD